MILWFFRPIFTWLVGILVDKQKKTGLLPRDYFYLVARLVPLPAVELLVLRKSKAGVQIFLTKRSVNDPHWPNLWHFPGTVFRNGDSLDSVKQRLADELGVASLPGEMILKDLVSFKMLPRGYSASSVYVMWTELKDLPNGQFFPLSDLPKDMIDFQREYLIGYKDVYC